MSMDRIEREAHWMTDSEGGSHLNFVAYGG